MSRGLPQELALKEKYEIKARELSKLQEQKDAKERAESAKQKVTTRITELEAQLAAAKADLSRLKVQVAAQGTHHLKVTKTSSDTSVETSLRRLDDEEKVQEIARMLGGVKISPQTLAHAREMLDN